MVARMEGTWQAMDDFLQELMNPKPQRIWEEIRPALSPLTSA